MVAGDGHRYLADDADLAIADRFGVDPFAVDHVWPVELRARALALMAVEARKKPRAKWWESK